MDTHTENVHQTTLRSWIEAGLSIPGVRELHGDAGEEIMALAGEGLQAISLTGLMAKWRRARLGKTAR